MPAVDRHRELLIQIAAASTGPTGVSKRMRKVAATLERAGRRMVEALAPIMERYQ